MKYALPLLLTAALLAGAAPARAQRPLLSTDVAADTARQNYGPHRRHFRHLYGGWLPVLGQPARPGAELRPWVSSEVQLGLREKLQLTPLLAIGADVRYVRLQYALRQNAAKVLPTPTLHKSELLVLHRLDLEGLARLRFGRQGNTVGRYVDVSGWGGWVAGTTHRTDDEPTSGSVRRLKTVETGLAYCRRWQYGVGARLGSQRFALVGRYRLSNAFRGPLAATYPEPPRWVLGIEIGLL